MSQAQGRMTAPSSPRWKGCSWLTSSAASSRPMGLHPPDPAPPRLPLDAPSTVSTTVRRAHHGPLSQAPHDDGHDDGHGDAHGDGDGQPARRAACWGHAQTAHAVGKGMHDGALNHPPPRLISAGLAQQPDRMQPVAAVDAAGVAQCMLQWDATERSIRRL
jgi:hypothetical protein